ncbi:MAG: ZIP family metal transporter [Methanobacterium sp.]
MILDINNIGPLSLTLVVTLFMWFIGALGAATVFLTKDVHPKFNISSLGFAAGILISVSLFSLILPAIQISNSYEFVWFPVSLGFILGVVSIIVLYRILPHHMPHHMSNHNHMHENVKHQNIRKRNRLLIISLALHHIPENLTLGITFVAAYVTFGLVTFTAAFSLAIGLAIHNFPEGMAASLPLRTEGMSPKKSFLFGQSIGIVAQVAGIIGALLVTTIEPVIPYALGFAAGAMLFVTTRHIIPHIIKSQHRKIGAIFAISGFILMMILELFLG